MGAKSSDRRNSCYNPLALSQWMSFVSHGLQVAWTLALISLYGRDILYCALRNEPRPPTRIAR